MEQKLKERLTGTVVLVLLAVIVLPLLLDDTRRVDTRITATNIPEKPEDKFTTRLVPILEQDEILPEAELEEVIPAPADADEATIAEAESPVDTTPVSYTHLTLPTILLV